MGKPVQAMNVSFLICSVVLVLMLARWGVELWLRGLNRRHVLAHANAVPDAFKNSIDDATYARSVEYTLAKSKFSQIENTYGLVVLLVVLFSGVLPWAFYSFARGLGDSAWAMAAFLFVIGFALSLPGLPLDWYAQFRLEDRFGFNTTTQRLWWLDRIKGLLLGLALG